MNPRGETGVTPVRMFVGIDLISRGFVRIITSLGLRGLGQASPDKA
jgi:hypothetical protein